MIPMFSNLTQKTARFLFLILCAIQWRFVTATSTFRDHYLHISCSEEHCPNQQCWKVNATNPFDAKAKWRVFIEARDAGRIWLNEPNDTRVEETGTLGLFEVKSSNGSDLSCVTNGVTQSLEVCISSAATASRPHIKIEHEQDAERCQEQFFEATEINDEDCQARCTPPCYCPSSRAPIEDPPQFVVVTWDDAFMYEEDLEHIFAVLHDNQDVRDYCGGYPRHTFFVTNQHTNYAALSHVLTIGAEYALHTVVHEDWNFAESEEYWNRQIEDGLHWAKRLVPSLASKEEFNPTGFRAPWLAHNNALYKVLSTSTHVIYDSSLPSFSRPIWPYTLDFGAHEGCVYHDASGIYRACPSAGEFPGVWEFPINPLLSKNGEVYSFDPSGSAMEILHLWKDHLRHSYDGNRAPMMISLHSQQFFKQDIEQRKRILRNFFLTIQHEYAANGKKVVFATMRQIIDWMKSGAVQDSKEEFCAYFKLPHTDIAPSPENPEICDGWDNDGDEQVDEHVINKCTYPAQHSPFPENRMERYLYTCASCPSQHPADGSLGLTDDGKDRVWKGRSSTQFEFFDLEDGSVGFSAKIGVRNLRGVPTQRWYLRLRTRGLLISSYYGVTPSSPLKNEVPTPVSIFESLPENGIIGALGELSDVQIGGKLQEGREDCISSDNTFLEQHCWHLEAFLTETTQNTI